MSKAELESFIRGAEIEDDQIGQVIDFLLYYGILGLMVPDDQVHYIFNVNYDLKILQIRAARASDEDVYVMNPAFVPALGIRGSD